MSERAKQVDLLKRKLTRKMMKAVRAFNLIAPGDRIMVGVSGGKDSYTLLDLLTAVRRRSPFDFGIVAVHLDQGQPGYDGRSLEAWLNEYGCEFEIVRQDIFHCSRTHEARRHFLCPCCVFGEAFYIRRQSDLDVTKSR